MEPSNEDIERELQREIDGAANPDGDDSSIPVRRNCAFCCRERTPKDDNHAPNCPYWVWFG